MSKTKRGKVVAANLLAIILVGVIGIFLIAGRVPQAFFWISIGLLVAFAVLIPPAVRGFRWAFVTGVILAAFVIVGNTASPAHLRIMLSQAEPLSAIILLLGGYGLQASLITLCVTGLRSQKR